MFRNPVVVRAIRYPVDLSLVSGLEIPLDIMAGLARTQRINTSWKAFIKGFSTMLVLTRYSGDLLLWHLLQ